MGCGCQLDNPRCCSVGGQLMYSWCGMWVSTRQPYVLLSGWVIEVQLVWDGSALFCQCQCDDFKLCSQI